MPERSTSISAGSVASSSANTRSFTEAVPLSLSSMAHMSIPLEDGVLDGIRQVLSHMLLCCVNYARIQHPPHPWSFRDLIVSPFAWMPVEGDRPTDLPFFLHKQHFQHEYSRNAWIYLKPMYHQKFPAASATNNNTDDLNATQNLQTAEQELEANEDDGWTAHAVGRISLLYASKEPLTPAEMQGVDVEEMPACILYKVVAEYLSLPPTGNQQAVQAEELSMLSFGGSLDDDVKYGALASLYDKHAKYVLEIYSVRGRKYKFDLMDSTLNDGTVPRLPGSRENDPFVKSLCATVTEHNLQNPVVPELVEKDEVDNAQDTTATTTSTTEPVPKKQKKNPYAVTRMHLTLEGKPRVPLDQLPKFDHVVSAIIASFLPLNPEPPSMVIAKPSGHILLLDPSLAGQVFVNGRYVTRWGDDPSIGSNGIALFGMDLHSIPFWNGKIVDYQAMRVAYAQLWHEILIDARLVQRDIAKRLMYRLMMGYDMETNMKDGGDDGYDDEIDTDVDSLESQVLAAPEYDVVGIAAKALATRFYTEFGKSAFPCLEHEVDWASTMLPGRKPVVVPQRLLKVLRRGGHFNVQQTHDEVFFVGMRSPKQGDEMQLVETAVDLLVESGCDDVEVDQVVFSNVPGADEPVNQKAVCRYDKAHEQYVIQESFLSFVPDGCDEDDTKELLQRRAYLLGLYLAMEIPDGSVLANYCLQHKSP